MRSTMPGILIVAHAPLASSLKAVAAHVFASAEVRIEAYDMPADIDMAQAEAQLRQLLAKVRDPQALVLVDLVGASPFNAAVRLAGEPGVRVVAGANVPMLLRAMCYSDRPLDELAELALDGARQGVLPATAPGPQNQASRGARHDPLDRQDQ
jgi:PTS system ascorbate-specific IIA component